jgi:aldose 1-epimerase
LGFFFNLGGFKSFDRKPWKIVQVLENGLVLSLKSPDGEEGYPGNLEATITYTLVEAADSGLNREQ